MPRSITALTTVAALLIGGSAFALPHSSSPASTAGIKWTLGHRGTQTANYIVPKPDPYRKG